MISFRLQDAKKNLTIFLRYNFALLRFPFRLQDPTKNLIVFLHYNFTLLRFPFRLQDTGGGGGEGRRLRTLHHHQEVGPLRRERHTRGTARQHDDAAGQERGLQQPGGVQE